MADTYHDPGSFPGCVPEFTCTAEHPDSEAFRHPDAVPDGPPYRDNDRERWHIEWRCPWCGCVWSE
jgi:hypothetical protein